MNIRPIRSSAAVAALLASPAAAEPPGPPPQPDPFGALFSADKAFAIAFEQVCLSAFLDHQPIEALARANHFVAMNPKLAGATPRDKVWRIASLSKVYVVAWADGSCSSSSELGDPDALAKAALASAERRGLLLRPGAVDTAAANGRRTAYCTLEPQPIVLAITARTAKRDKRPALLTTVFRARGPWPSFCGPQPA